MEDDRDLGYNEAPIVRVEPNGVPSWAAAAMLVVGISAGLGVGRFYSTENHKDELNALTALVHRQSVIIDAQKDDPTVFLSIKANGMMFDGSDGRIQISPAAGWCGGKTK